MVIGEAELSLLPPADLASTVIALRTLAKPVPPKPNNQLRQSYFLRT